LLVQMIEVSGIDDIEPSLFRRLSHLHPHAKNGHAAPGIPNCFPSQVTPLWPSSSWIPCHTFTFVINGGRMAGGLPGGHPAASSS
jgi:hypothetical protein